MLKYINYFQKNFMGLHVQRYVTAGDLRFDNESWNSKTFSYEGIVYKRNKKDLEDNGYIEIETPVLIDRPSGTTARSFVSHHNTLDMNDYLRIAPETYLKRGIVHITIIKTIWNPGISRTGGKIRLLKRLSQNLFRQSSFIHNIQFPIHLSPVS